MKKNSEELKNRISLLAKRTLIAYGVFVFFNIIGLIMKIKTMVYIFSACMGIAIIVLFISAIVFANIKD